jgi:hypothetical protein
VLRVWPNYKTAIAAVCHNDMDVMLDSEITAPSPQFGSATKVKQQLLKEHRRVQAEHELTRKNTRAGGRPFERPGTLEQRRVGGDASRLGGGATNAKRAPPLAISG